MSRSSTAARRAQVTRSVDSIRRIVRALRLAAQRTQTEAGVTAAQLFVLAALRDASPCSLTELGARTHTDRTSVRDIVNRLAEEGLVRRGTSDVDRRQASVELTEAGRALLDRAPTPPTALLIDGLSAMDDGELASLTASLDRLVGAMGIAESPAEMLFSDDAPQAGRRTRTRTRAGADG
jgi:DNA-binding MarR family transcriptional regulator